MFSTATDLMRKDFFLEELSRERERERERERAAACGSRTVSWRVSVSCEGPTYCKWTSSDSLSVSAAAARGVSSAKAKVWQQDWRTPVMLPYLQWIVFFYHDNCLSHLKK